MSRGSTLVRYGGLAGAAVGALATGGAAGAVFLRRSVSRRRTAEHAGLGTLHAEPQTVVTDDGLELHVEVDVAENGDPSAPTLIFVHGYALNLDSWHFQRAALRGRFRMVFYDQRSHGRSTRSDRDNSTIDWLVSDLIAVMDQVAGDGPVVLIGHSMGAMTILALAGRHPEWFGTRVVGVGLISASAGDLRVGSLGVPGIAGRLMDMASPGLIAGLARIPRVVELSRRAGSDLAFVLTGAFGFGPQAPSECVDFTDRMLTDTPFGVVADFYATLNAYESYEALPALASVPTVVVAGALDPLTPVAHARRIVDDVPAAELREVADAGHMVLLEAHEQVTAALVEMIERAKTA